MGDACEKIENILCHELDITDDGDFLVVFMSRAGSRRAANPGPHDQNEHLASNEK